MKEKNGFLTFDEWVSESNNLRPRIGDDSCYSDEENGQYYWNLHKKYKKYLKDWENQNFGPDPDEAWVRIKSAKSNCKRTVAEDSQKGYTFTSLTNTAMRYRRTGGFAINAESRINLFLLLQSSYNEVLGSNYCENPMVRNMEI